MDERIFTVLKVLAYGRTAEQAASEMCLYCDYDQYRESDQGFGLHEPTCPIRVARAILKEQGTPIYLYDVDVERREHTQQWYRLTYLELAFTEQEAVQPYADSHLYRNVRATLVREVL